MWLLGILLNKREYLDDILTTLLDLYIEDVVVLESSGIAKTLAMEVPIFAGLQLGTEETERFRNTILVLVKKKETVDRLQGMLREGGIDFRRKGTGVLFLAPLVRVVSESLNFDSCSN